MKKNIILFISGIIFAVVLGLVSKIMLPKVHPFYVKVRTKLADRQFNHTPKANRECLLFDFENSAEVGKWKLINASIELVKEHATRSGLAAKVNFEVGKQVSAIKLTGYFEQPGVTSDWSGYQSLAFDIFNPQDKQERIVLQVKDKKGEEFKEGLILEPNAVTTVEIEMARLRHALNIYNIGDFTLFLWEPKEKKIFFIDNVRLLPYGEKDNKTILLPEFIEAPETAYVTGDYFDFSKNKQKWLKTDKNGQSFVEFPIFLVNETNLDHSDLPFSAGIPFPRGEIKDASHIEILDGNTPIDFQSKPLCRWQDGSLKWLLICLKSSLAGNMQKEFRLRYSGQFNSTEKNSVLKVDDISGQITINTGPLRFIVKKQGFNLFDKVWIDANKDGIFQDEELICQNGNLSIKFKGKVYLSSQDKESKVTIEDGGPLKTTLRAEGWFINDKGEKFCKYIVRIQAFAKESYLRVYHTFIYTGYPENKYHYLYNGKRLPKNETIKAITINLPFNLVGDKLFTFEADSQVIQGTLNENTEIIQNNFNAFTVEKSTGKVHSGAKLGGWLDLSDKQRGLAVGLKNYWEQFPKEIFLDKNNNSIIISLWPEKAGELDLKTTAEAVGPDDVARGSAFGLAKTHELEFYFHPGSYQESKVRNIICGLKESLPIKVDPQWISDTVALGKLANYDGRLAPAEETLEKLFTWGERQKQNFNWYGMLDFGDTLSWYRKEAYDKSYDDWGWHPEGRWGWFNCEAVGTHTGSLLQYLRTGQIKYFKFSEELTLHVMDVDTCHYNTIANDRRLKGVIFDDYSQVGSMHRHSANHWSGRNEETTHTNLTGILLYYYITGYERAFDVAKEIGEFFLKEHITYFRHPDVAPQRGIANVLWGDVLMYEVTRDERYKRAADKWADIFYRGQHNNGSWSQDYNPVENRWDGDPHLGYTVGYTMPALIEYHKLTRNKAIGETIIKATQYLIKNDEYGHQFDAIAYSFWLTKDNKFKEEGQKRLDHLIAHQNHGDDSIMEGMIYGKAYYCRVVDFLSRTPFIYEVLTYPLKETGNE